MKTTEDSKDRDIIKERHALTDEQLNKITGGVRAEDFIPAPEPEMLDYEIIEIDGVHYPRCRKCGHSQLIRVVAVDDVYVYIKCACSAGYKVLRSSC